jgi:hypothetical protein
MIFLSLLLIVKAPAKRKAKDEEHSRQGKLKCDVAAAHSPPAHLEEAGCEYISQPGQGLQQSGEYETP